MLDSDLIDEHSSRNELLMWLQGASRADLVTLLTVLGNLTGKRYSREGLSKTDMLDQLKKVKSETLYEAICIAFDLETEDLEEDEDENEEESEEDEEDDEECEEEEED